MTASSLSALYRSSLALATDLYQLGVLLYALLAHSHPYGLTGDTPLRTRLVRMDGNPQPLDTEWFQTVPPPTRCGSRSRQRRTACRPNWSPRPPVRRRSRRR